MMSPSFHTTKAALIACVATAAFGLGGHAPGLAQESKPEYAIKEDIPGSRIRSNAIEFNSVALNLPYSELSAQDRANLHS